MNLPSRPKRLTAAFRDSNHDRLSDEINQWVTSQGALLISISVTREPNYFHAFIIYELPE